MIEARQELLQVLRATATVGDPIEIELGNMLRKVEEKIGMIFIKYGIRKIAHSNTDVIRDIDVIDAQFTELLRAVAVRRRDLKDFIEESERKAW